jgi:hypothetical protein
MRSALQRSLGAHLPNARFVSAFESGRIGRSAPAHASLLVELDADASMDARALDWKAKDVAAIVAAHDFTAPGLPELQGGHVIKAGSLRIVARKTDDRVVVSKVLESYGN